MKILLDECIPRKLKRDLKEFKVYSVFDFSWEGIKNGALLKLMVENGFDILLTIDKNLKYQQNILQHDVTIVVLDVKRSKIELMKKLLPEFKERINKLKKFRVYEIK